MGQLPDSRPQLAAPGSHNTTLYHGEPHQIALSLPHCTRRTTLRPLHQCVPWIRTPDFTPAHRTVQYVCPTFHSFLLHSTLCPMYFLPPDTQLQKKYMLLFGGDLHLQCHQNHCRAKMLMLQMSKLKYRRGGVAYLWSRCLIMSKKRRCTIAICGNYCTTTPENKATMKVQKRVKIQKEFCPLHAVLLLSFQRH